MAGVIGSQTEAVFMRYGNDARGNGPLVLREKLLTIPRRCAASGNSLELWRLGPPGAIGEKFAVSKHGHEDVSHVQGPWYVEKHRVAPYGTQARIAGPPYFTTPYVPWVASRGLCESLIKKPWRLTVNFPVLAPGGPS
jgi:hypothetical protein